MPKSPAQLHDATLACAVEAIAASIIEVTARPGLSRQQQEEIVTHNAATLSIDVARALYTLICDKDASPADLLSFLSGACELWRLQLIEEERNKTKN